jgi:hypothetical protein
MRCTSPADVYLALKASDFVQHDLLPSSAFEGTSDTESNSAPISLELVLRKWYPFDRSREVRCFVRDGRFIGDPLISENKFHGTETRCRCMPT